MASQRIPLYCIADSCKDHGIRKDAGATYPPLALGMMLAHARTFADVWDRYELVRTVISTEEELKRSYREHGPGVFLFSDYIWTIQNNLRLSALSKHLDPRCLNIHGGPSVPKYEEPCRSFFSTYPHVDVGVHGEGENTCVDLLRAIADGWEDRAVAALPEVAGITCRSGADPSAIVRTVERAREKDLDRFPSPYLTDVFGVFHNAPQSWTAAIIETNRGCPYGCTFCDWGSATLQKIYQFSLDRVAQEIQWFAEHKVDRLWIADANFGIFARDTAIADLICEARSKYGYPRDVIVNYAKNATNRLAEIVRRFKKASLYATGIISIQTHDPETLANVKRANIKTERYEELIEIFRDEGLPVSSDLLIGLPGSTVESFKQDLQFFIDRQVHTVVYPVMVLTNSPMGEPSYMKEFGITLDPNRFVVSANSFSREDLWMMKMIFGVYRSAVGYSILRYLLYYLQIEGDVAASEFIHALAMRLQESGNGMPRASQVFMRHGLSDDRAALLAMSEAEWQELYEEVLDFAAETFAVRRSTALAAMVAAQIALMPRLGRAMPARVSLPHDIGAYFAQFLWRRDLSDIDPAAIRPLEDYGPAEFTVADPDELCRTGWSPPIDLHHPPRWELRSSLSQARGPRPEALDPKAPRKLAVL